MNLRNELVLAFVVLIAWIDAILLARVMSNKATRNLAADRRSRELSALARLFEKGRDLSGKASRRLLRNYNDLRQSIVLPEGERRTILELAGAERIEPRLARHIRSPSRRRRLKAAQGLGLIATGTARETLESALAAEKDFPVKLFIANALADIGDGKSIRPIVESLVGAHRWYRDKVNMLVASFGGELLKVIGELRARPEDEIKELLVDVSGSCTSAEMKEFLTDIVASSAETLEAMGKGLAACPERSCARCVHGQAVLPDLRRDCPINGKEAPDFRCGRFRALVTARDPAANYRRIVVKAAEALEARYPKVLDDPRFLEHADEQVRAVAVRSLGVWHDEPQVLELVGYLDGDMAQAAREGLSRILDAHPRLIPFLVGRFEESSGARRERLAGVLAGRMEYFIAKLASEEKAGAEKVIREVIAQGRVSEIVEFLRTNRDPGLEDILVRIVRETAPENPALAKECGLYLDERVLAKCGLPRITMEAPRREEVRDARMIRVLWLVLFAAFLFFPALYVLGNLHRVATVPFLQQLRNFVVQFNYDFAFYSLAVSVVYFVLLGLSMVNVRNLSNRWDLKTMSMLFKPRMLPSVSILAPAYNEEKNIIESVNSLLNLKYPDYELIVVNDGSKDGTLAALISSFGLRRTDQAYLPKLRAKPVRGIYRNPLLPRLTVVDKENGGKADALNAGINVASREYFCGIDADSLLEPEALLRVASLTLDWGVETPAIGGNVFPSNGCEVDRGRLSSVKLARSPLARLQTVEYMRAFMCGRLGWAQMNSLLIISGAFGLFRKERIIEIGGYMSKEERYVKDTVGEDMELVVRISRMMREKKLKYRIGYAFNANCWTEVPEDMGSLVRQRDRWHRGLIDILFFHRRLLLNPAYGRMGVLGLPYFFLIEVFGPLLEAQGYIMVIVAAALGLLSLNLALMLFVSTILTGVLISMASVLIAETNVAYFGFTDAFRMLLVAVAENFGPRQLFSMWRVIGYFSAMKKPKGWGAMERKGFTAAGTSAGTASRGPGGAA